MSCGLLRSAGCNAEIADIGRSLDLAPMRSPHHDRITSINGREARWSICAGGGWPPLLNGGTLPHT
jgi:hypothetical protein